jgi:molecular chaperone DnaJ
VSQGEAFSVLGVRRDASPREVTAAYRQLVKLYHPDTSPVARVERFHEIRKAYEQMRPLLRDGVEPLRIDVYG